MAQLQDIKSYPLSITQRNVVYVTHANQFSWLVTAMGGTSKFRCSYSQKVRGLGLHSHRVLNLRTGHGRLTWVKGTTKVPLLHQLCYNSRPKQTLGYRHAHARSNAGCTLPVPVSERSALRLCGSTLSVSSVTSVCRSVAAGRMKGEM